MHYMLILLCNVSTFKCLTLNKWCCFGWLVPMSRWIPTHAWQVLVFNWGACHDPFQLRGFFRAISWVAWQSKASRQLNMMLSHLRGSSTTNSHPLERYFPLFNQLRREHEKCTHAILFVCVWLTTEQQIELVFSHCVSNAQCSETPKVPEAKVGFDPYILLSLCRRAHFS